MKKVLIFKVSASDIVAVPVDRIASIHRSADATVLVTFDDMQNVTSKCGTITLTCVDDTSNLVKDWMENLSKEIAYGKTSAIMVYDKLTDSGACNAENVFTNVVNTGITNI